MKRKLIIIICICCLFCFILGYVGFNFAYNLGEQAGYDWGYDIAERECKFYQRIRL